MSMTMARLITCPGCKGHRRFAIRPRIYVPCQVCRGTGMLGSDDIVLTGLDRALAAEQVKDEFIKRSQYGG